MNESNSQISNPKIIAALDDYVREIGDHVRAFPLQWAPCYESLNTDGKEVGPLSEDAVQWSVCGLLQLKLSSHPYGQETIVARRLAGALLGLICFRLLNYEDPERIESLIINADTLRNAGGTHSNIHAVEVTLGIVGVQDCLATLAKKLPVLQEAIQDTELTREFCAELGARRKESAR